MLARSPKDGALLGGAGRCARGPKISSSATTTMRSLGSVGLDAADYLGQAAFGFGSVWFPTWGDNTLLRVKPL